MATTETNGGTTMQSVLAHPAVATYLDELDRALRGSSAPHAGDLRDQVRAHIEDALAPDATDAEIEATLARLGRPERLAVGEDEPPATVVYAIPSLTVWLRHRHRSFWAAIVAAVALLIAATVAVTVETHVAPMEATCFPCAFAFPQDRLHMRDPSAFDLNHMIVTQRFGEDQAISFALYNPSRYAQVVSGGVLDAPSLEPQSLDISTVGPGHENPIGEWPRHFTTGDVSVPSHSYRQVVMHLVQDQCALPGNTMTYRSVELKVVTLGVTRTDNAQIGESFTIVGSSASHHCRMGQIAHATVRTSQ